MPPGHSRRKTVPHPGTRMFGRMMTSVSERDGLAKEGDAAPAGPSQSPGPEPFRSIGSRLKALLVNTALVVAGVVVGYFALELVFFRLLLPNVQLNVRPYLPETAGVLVQSSKAAYVPKDYIAILGDSYAEGLGDWLLSVAENEADAFHSAHVIRSLTGRDTVTFGRGGSSSAEALVRQPSRVIAGSRCAIFPTIEEPKRIFAYFYEGNDIQDNLTFAKKVQAAYGSSDAAAIDRYLADEYGSFASWRCQLYLGDLAARMVKFLKRYYTDPPVMRPRRPGGSLLLVGGKTIDAPAPLEGPALEVDDAGLAAGVTVFERSIAWLRRRFPNVPIAVVYVPAPLSTYRLAGESYRHVVEPEEAQRSASTPVARIASHSEAICTMVRAASLRQGVGFIDSRPPLRTAATSGLIHGPVDWAHLNKDGYTVLGGALARRIQDETPADPCR